MTLQFFTIYLITVSINISDIMPEYSQYFLRNYISNQLKNISVSKKNYDHDKIYHNNNFCLRGIILYYKIGAALAAPKFNLVLWCG
jgi:hypothetical protein